MFPAVRGAPGLDEENGHDWKTFVEWGVTQSKEIEEMVMTIVGFAVEDIPIPWEVAVAERHNEQIIAWIDHAPALQNIMGIALSGDRALENRMPENLAYIDFRGYAVLAAMYALKCMALENEREVRNPEYITIRFLDRAKCVDLLCNGQEKRIVDGDIQSVEKGIARSLCRLGFAEHVN